MKLRLKINPIEIDPIGGLDSTNKLIVDNSKVIIVLAKFDGLKLNSDISFMSRIGNHSKNTSENSFLDIFKKILGNSKTCTKSSLFAFLGWI